MNWLNSITAHLTLFDYLVILLLLGFLARGIWIGFIRQISVLIALVAGFVTAGQLHADFYHLLLPYLHHTLITFLLTYIILFGLIYGGVVLLGLGLRKVVTLSLLGWFDRTLGGLFGLAKGFFLAILLFMVLANFVSGGNRVLREAVFYPVLERSTAILLGLIKDHDLREGFLPREPAIPPDAPPPPPTPPEGESPSAEEPAPPEKAPEYPPREGILL